MKNLFVLIPTLFSILLFGCQQKTTTDSGQKLNEAVEKIKFQVEKAMNEKNKNEATAQEKTDKDKEKSSEPSSPD